MALILHYFLFFRLVVLRNCLHFPAVPGERGRGVPSKEPTVMLGLAEFVAEGPKIIPDNIAAVARGRLRED